MPLEEEYNVDRQVCDHDITDIATDFEPRRVRWSDQFSRHDALLSVVEYHAAAELRDMGNSPKMRLLIGRRIGMKPETL